MSKDSSRVAALLEVARPVVQKAVSDPEFHGALKRAFAVGKEVNDQVSGKPPSAIARKLAYDRRLQRKVENSALDLQKAVVALVEQPRKRRMRGLITKIVIVGAAAGAVIVVLRRVRGGGDEVLDAEL